ncbi:MAG: phosphatidate cytidylyltransferase [Burkholderiaceae bacterium]|jgi:phosphatidate cytidylyltransferase|nr:phosphatidate cytidylyltransferase [Burkholderiaceae bacterium]
MLKQRVLTALVLLVIFLPALFCPSNVPFAMVLLVFACVGAWEWGRLNGCSARPSIACGALIAAMCALSWALGLYARSLPALWLCAGAAWLLGGAALLRAGVAGWPSIPKVVRLAGGLLVLWLVWLAGVQARTIGNDFLLSVLVLVWITDIAAYFAGRAFGLRFTRRKLAPTISPGKTWEGVWGGMVGALLLAAGWAIVEGRLSAARAVDAAPVLAHSLYSVLLMRGVWLLVLGVLFLAAMSVVGDLVESMVKRSAGVKDSSTLLPGHGGVLDRIDAMLPALPLAMMLVSCFTNAVR